MRRLSATMMPGALTLDVVLERARRLFADVEVVSRRPDRALARTTYGALTDRARALAQGLLREGLRPGEPVATLCWNHAQHLEAYFGIPLAGGVVHTLNLRLHADELAFIASHAGDRFVIVDEALLPVLQRFRDRAPFEQVFVVRNGSAPLAPGLRDVEELLAPGGGSEQPLPPLREEDPCGLCYTSGTTGRPKGVVYTHRSTLLHCMSLAMADVLALSQHDVVLPVVPMFHVNAWGQPYAAAFLGAPLVLAGPHLDPLSLLELLEGEQVTIASGVPSLWQPILDRLDGEPGRWKLHPKLRMVVGGSAASESLLRGFARHGVELWHAWGMTETSPVGAVSRPKRSMSAWSEEQLWTVRRKQGVAPPLVEMRARDEQGREVPWDGRTPGELEVRGPWVAGSYLEPAEEGASARWSADGWFRTGDIVTLDAAGFLEITDRAKDLIKSGGEWISSVALESALAAHPAVQEAAVIAVPHPRWAERPLAAVVLRPGHTASAEELRAFLAARVAKICVPDAFDFVATLPRTPTGKLLKTALREHYKNWSWVDRVSTPG